MIITRGRHGNAIARFRFLVTGHWEAQHVIIWMQGEDWRYRELGLEVDNNQKNKTKKSHMDKHVKAF